MSDGIITQTIPGQSNYAKGIKEPGGKVTGVMLAGNGTTNFGEVVGGTLMEQGLGAGGDQYKVRPARLTAVVADSTAENVVRVDSAANFYVGDTCKLQAPADAPGYTGIALAGETLWVLDYDESQKAKALILTDPGGASSLSVAVTEVAGVLEIDVTLAHSGAAITSTLGDVAAALNALGLSLVVSSTNDATVTTALARTDLNAYVKAGDDILAGRTVTAVDKTSTPNTLTLDGAAFSLSASQFAQGAGGFGPVVAPEGQTDYCVGLLEIGTDTLDKTTGTHIERTVPIVKAVWYQQGYLTGLNHNAKAGFVEALIAQLAVVPPVAGLPINAATSRLQKALPNP